MEIEVAFLPKDIGKMELFNKVCIVLDIFRATTSMVTAMANGCKTIIPVVSIENARAISQQIGQALFAGERKSLKIEGFDFGNSPFEFSREKVKNQVIIMTTTNGTAAVNATQEAFRILIGAFVNAQAVCRQAQQLNKDILIVCAGTQGAFSLEDSLCAGLLVKLLSQNAKANLTDSAQGVLLMYTAAEENLLAAAMTSQNGRRLLELDRANEVEYCLQQSIVDVVPEYGDKQIRLNSK